MFTTHNTLVDTSNTEKLYDLCMIEKLCRGNAEKIKQMVQVFIEQVPGTVAQIKNSFKQKDGPAIKDAAHQIKPVLGMYAVVKVENDIKEIEALGKQGIISGELEARIEKLDTVITQIVEQMKKSL